MCGILTGTAISWETGLYYSDTHCLWTFSWKIKIKKKKRVLVVCPLGPTKADTKMQLGQQHVYRGVTSM